MKLSRNTTAKTEIKNFLISSGKAFSQIEIQNHLIGLCDRVTTYRILKRLTDEGIIHKIINTDGITKYAASTNTTTEKSNHIHFSCYVCNSLTCLDSVIPSFNIPENYIVKETTVTLSGICSQCAVDSIAKTI